MILAKAGKRDFIRRGDCDLSRAMSVLGREIGLNSKYMEKWDLQQESEWGSVYGTFLGSIRREGFPSNQLAGPSKAGQVIRYHLGEGEGQGLSLAIEGNQKWRVGLMAKQT